MKTATIIHIAACAALTVPLISVGRGSEEIPLPPDVPESVELPIEALPIGLDEVTRLALAQNPDVIIAGLAYDALATRDQAAESIYDFNLTGRGRWTDERVPPAVSFFGSETDTRDFLVGLSKLLPMGTLLNFEAASVRTYTDNEFATVNPGYNLDYRVTVKQPLLQNFLGFIERGKIGVVRLDIRKFNYETLGNIEGSLLQARDAYWDLLEAQEKFAADVAAFKNAAEFYRLTKEKLPFGLTEEPDVIAADGNLRRNYIISLITRADYENASDILKEILNIHNVEYLRAEPRALLEQEIDIDGELKRAFERRFDLKAALIESRKKGLELKINRNGLLPRLNFEGSFALNALERRFDEAAGAAWSADGRGFYVGGSLDFPLENRLARADYRRSKIDKRKALEEITKTELAIIREVLVAARGVKVSYTAAVQAEKTYLLESEKLEAENKRFVQGRSSSDTIIRFQFDKFEAQKFNITSTVAHFRAQDRLMRAKNSLIDTVAVTGSPPSVDSLEPKGEVAP